MSHRGRKPRKASYRSDTITTDTPQSANRAERRHGVTLHPKTTDSRRKKLLAQLGKGRNVPSGKAERAVDIEIAASARDVAPTLLRRRAARLAAELEQSASSAGSPKGGE